MEVSFSSKPGNGFLSAQGPCYRCLYPEPPPADMAPSCAEAGVLGVLPGLIGVIEALEAIKLILDKGDSLIGRLLCFNTLTMEINTLKLQRDPNCPMCGDHPTIPFSSSTTRVLQPASLIPFKTYPSPLTPSVGG